ncbi:hypothetical protein BRC90_03540 [Halobacteriales archaeon QS_4_69_34]|nr:MAG: hypothetical protein BRC90_03540 [Halobacteriales archaeon QS_4_69_34]
MFVGHALLAFALAGLGARSLGRSRERALLVGAVAGAFAAIPDVDVVYAPVGALGASGPLEAASGFWAASTLVHRTITHSLVVGVVTAAALALWADALRRGASGAAVTTGVGDGGRRTATRPSEDWRLRAAAALLTALALVALAIEGGVLGGVVTAAFVLAGLAVATAAARAAFPATTVLATALLGFVSHPFGDVFTGTPPAFLYPFDATPLARRVTLSTDPTLQVLGAFGIELVVIWFAAVVHCRLCGRRLRDHVHGRAAFGLTYAGVALLIPWPSLDTSYPFVFSVLAVGAIGPAPLVMRARRFVGATLPLEAPGSRRPSSVGRSGDRRDGRRWRRAADSDAALTAALTGLAAITVAALSYATVYFLSG